MSIRNPHASAAARLVKDFLKQHNMDLSHTQCLEIVALTQGYKNAQHAAVPKSPKSVTLTNADPKPHKLYVHFGEESSRVWEDTTNPKRKADLLKQATLQEFATTEELLAYAQGLDDGNGWGDYTLTTPDEAIRIFGALEGGVVHKVRVLTQYALGMTSSNYLQALQDLKLSAASDQVKNLAFSGLFAVSFPNALEGSDVFLKSIRLLETEQVAPDIEFFNWNEELHTVTFDSWHELEIVLKNNSCTLDEYLDELQYVECSFNTELDSKILGANWLRYSSVVPTVGLILKD
jgi:hypothetical protein